MTAMKRVILAALLVFGSLLAVRVIAQVIMAPPISGNFALTTAGYEIVTDGLNTFHFDIVGEGLVTADGGGNLSGSANFTATNPSSSNPGPFSVQCPGTLAGTAAEPGDGDAQIQLQFTPSNPVPSGVAVPSGIGPQEACIPMTIALSCVELYPDSGYVTPFLSSGAANPASAEPTPTATPAPKKKKKRRSKADASVTPVEPLPPSYLSSATRLKCIAIGVTTTSTTSSVEGESLTVDLQQTAPASVSVPPPVIVPPPVTGSSPIPGSYPTPSIPQAPPGTND